MSFTGKIIAAVACLAIVSGLIMMGLKQFADGIRAEERNKVIERATELVRDTDKRLGVNRKASNADLCRGMGGEPGECTNE
jgi:hypothetical protein